MRGISLGYKMYDLDIQVFLWQVFVKLLKHISASMSMATAHYSIKRNKQQPAACTLCVNRNLSQHRHIVRFPCDSTACLSGFKV